MLLLYSSMFIEHDTDVPLSKMRMNIKRSLFEGGILNNE